MGFDLVKCTNVVWFDREAPGDLDAARGARRRIPRSGPVWRVGASGSALGKSPGRAARRSRGGVRVAPQVGAEVVAPPLPIGRRGVAQMVDVTPSGSRETRAPVSCWLRLPSMLKRIGDGQPPRSPVKRPRTVQRSRAWPTSRRAHIARVAPSAPLRSRSLHVVLPHHRAPPPGSPCPASAPPGRGPGSAPHPSPRP